MAALLLLPVGSGAGTGALQDCLARLDGMTEKMGRPQAGEVASELGDLIRAKDRLRAKADDYGEEWVGLDQERQALDAARRLREQRLAEIDHAMRVLNSEIVEHNRRGDAHDADALEQHAAIRAARSEAEAASAIAWGVRVDARKALLERQAGVLNERGRQLVARKSEIESNFVYEAERSNIRDQHELRLRDEVAEAAGKCAALTTRASALGRIADAPARAIDYRSPDAIAEGVADSLLKDMGVSVLGAYLQHGQGARNVFKPALKSLARWGIRGARARAIALAVPAFGLIVAALPTGMEQRDAEVLKNIYLVGDYAYALKVLLRERGRGAAASPEYQAIEAEIFRLSMDMPGSRARFVAESLANPVSVAEAFGKLATGYAAGRIGLRGGKWTNHFNNRQRAAFPEGGLRLTREASISAVETVAEKEIERVVNPSARRVGRAVDNRSRER
ncbi:MAG TPA: hypothetical protein VFZ91_13385 [Allosphingosinicella sp.]